MITQKEYELYTEDYWRGKRVITLKELNNGWFMIPSGTELEITRKYNGFSVEGLDICPHCNIGRKISISRVEPTAFRRAEEKKA